MLCVRGISQNYFSEPKLARVLEDVAQSLNFGGLFNFKRLKYIYILKSLNHHKSRLQQLDGRALPQTGEKKW